MMDWQANVQRYLEFCEFMKKLDWNTLKAYRIDLRQFQDHLGGEEIGKEQLERYITSLHKQYKQKTVKRKIASLRAFFGYLEEEGVIEVSPMRQIRTKFKEEKVLPRIIPRKDIECLLNSMYRELSIREEGNLLRDISIVEIFFSTGARVYEVSNIKLENIDLKSGTICFMGKGGKERYVQIGEETVLKLLKRYYEMNEEKIKASGYFFTNQRGGRYTEQSIRGMLRKYTERAGISHKITPHMFRHSFATYLIEEGVDISCVQQILGHSSIKTTQIYIYVAAKRQADILRQCHPRKKMRIIAA